MADHSDEMMERLADAAMLSHPDRRFRIQAVEAMIHRGDENAVAFLCRALSDSRKEVRAKAAQGLGRLQATEALEPLSAALSDRTAAVRKTAAEAVGRIAGAGAFEILVPLLDDGDHGVRRAVVNELFRMNDARIVGPLVARVETSLQSQRLRVIEAVMPFHDLGAIPMLCRSLKDGAHSVRHMAALALMGFGDAHTLPVRIVSAHDCTPQWRMDTLELLRQVRYGGWFDPLTLRFPIPPVREYCEQLVLLGQDPEIVRGARTILDNMHLLRGSRRDYHGESEALLRAANSAGAAPGQETLLRASEQSEPRSPEAAIGSAAAHRFWRRFVNWIRRR